MRPRSRLGFCHKCARALSFMAEARSSGRALCLAEDRQGGRYALFRKGALPHGRASALYPNKPCCSAAACAVWLSRMRLSLFSSRPATCFWSSIPLDSSSSREVKTRQNEASGEGATLPMKSSRARRSPFLYRLMARCAWSINELPGFSPNLLIVVVR